MARSSRCQIAPGSAASAADVSIVDEALDATSAASAADENDAGTSGVEQEMKGGNHHVGCYTKRGLLCKTRVEDVTPSDLLADLVKANAHDIKPEVRQDYARRMSKHYQFLLVDRPESHGCHAFNCRPTALPEKCLPNPRCGHPPRFSCRISLSPHSFWCPRGIPLNHQPSLLPPRPLGRERLSQESQTLPQLHRPLQDQREPLRPFPVVQSAAAKEERRIR